MLCDPATPFPSWRAALALEFDQRLTRTVLSARRHDGPLVVQKPHYPEGEAVCHTIIVHPPGGIAGGDELELTAALGPGSSVLMTTPGATKWYRSSGAWARQHIKFSVGYGASLEWLPQETIVFDGAQARTQLDLEIINDGMFTGWDIVCLGRTGSAETFKRGHWHAKVSIKRDGKQLWFERAHLAGNGQALEAESVMAGQPVVGTMVTVAQTLTQSLLATCREVVPLAGHGAVTLLPGIMVGRYLGGSSQAAIRYFTQLWQAIRPAVLNRPGTTPRIWQT